MLFLSLISCKNSGEMFTGTWVHSSPESKIYNDTLIVSSKNNSKYDLDLNLTFKSDSKFSNTKTKKENFTGIYNSENNLLELNNGKSMKIDDEGILIIGTTTFKKIND